MNLEVTTNTWRTHSNFREIHNPVSLYYIEFLNSNNADMERNSKEGVLVKNIFFKVST